jgi:hypothetical protein
LDETVSIKIFKPLYFLATKMEAIKGRASDLRMSHDFEDFIFVFSNTHDVVSEIEHSEEKLRSYLVNEISKLKSKRNFEEALEVCIPLGVEGLFELLNKDLEKITKL